MEINVAFIERINEHENFLMTMSIDDIYPSYKAMDIIFLQITNREQPEKAMRNTMFIIDKVIHSVREDVSRNHRNNLTDVLVATGFKYYLGMEVYVTRMDNA